MNEASNSVGADDDGPDFSVQMTEALNTFEHVADEAVDGIRDVFNAMEKEISSLRAQVSELEETAEEDDNEGQLIEAAQDLADSLERPLGKVTFNIKRQPDFDRAVDALLKCANINALSV